jgi:hypothetical protein
VERACLYAEWIAANAAAEAIGLGSTLVIAWRLAPLQDRLSGISSTFITALLAVALGTLLEGVVVGVAQEKVLLRRLGRLRPWSWITATAIGASCAWMLGVIPSTIAALVSSGSSSEPVAEPAASVQLLLAVLLGLATGPILGVAQWTVLRSLVTRAVRWLWANALAWAAGMPIVFLGMNLVPWTAHPLIVAASIYLVACTAGAVVGAIHGIILMQLLKETPSSRS